MLKRKPPPVARPALSKDFCPAVARFEMGTSERLVGLGFRYWVTGRKTGDIGAWERAWHLYSGELGVSGGKQAVGCLASWVGALSQSTCRRIEVCGRDGAFCRDECVAISMIAACQHRTCPAMRACAFALVECPRIDPAIARAQAFADTLASLDHVLSRDAIVPAPAAMPVGDQRPN